VGSKKFEFSGKSFHWNPKYSRESAWLFKYGALN